MARLGNESEADLAWLAKKANCIVRVRTQCGLLALLGTIIAPGITGIFRLYRAGLCRAQDGARV